MFKVKKINNINHTGLIRFYSKNSILSKVGNQFILWELIEKLVYDEQLKLVQLVYEYGMLSLIVQSYQKWLLLSINFRLLAVRCVFKKIENWCNNKIRGQYVFANLGSTSIFKLALDLLNLSNYHLFLLRYKQVLMHNKQKKSWRLTFNDIRDLCTQYLFKLILEPLVEIFSDKNNYGFRKNRLAGQALNKIKDILNKNNQKNILQCSVQGFSNKKFHLWLLKYLPVPQQFKLLFKIWIEMGLIDFSIILENPYGIPEEQGILVSSLINFSLNGLEEIGLNSTCPIISIDKKNYYLENIGFDKRLKTVSTGIQFIRFLDSIVLIAKSKFNLLEYVKVVVTNFLLVRGLLIVLQGNVFTLSERKLLYLGYDFIYVKKGIYQYKTLSSSFKTVNIVLIPQQENLNKFCMKMRTIFHFNTHKSSTDLILLLNRLIFNWCSYFCLGQAKFYYKYLDNYFYFLCWNWARRKHPKAGRRAIAQYYFLTPALNKWKKWIFRGASSANLFKIKETLNPVVFLKTPIFLKRQIHFFTWKIPLVLLRIHAYHTNIKSLYNFIYKKYLLGTISGFSNKC